MWYVCTPVLYLFSCISATTAQESAVKKAPVPDSGAQKQAEKTIRDVFKEEYARTGSADRMLLARKLLEEGVKATGDPATQYVLLREAQDVAQQAGDVDTAFSAIDEAATHYDVRRWSLKYSVVASVGKTAKTTEELRSLARRSLKLADEATVADDYETATKAAEAAGTLAKRAKELSLASRAAARATEIREIARRYERVTKAWEKLLSSPEDPAANFEVGRFQCLVKGDWETGMAKLARGSDPALRGLAGRDTAAPSGALEQAAVGDGWWDAGEKEGALERGNLRKRAAAWYEKALPEITGLLKSKVEKRVLEVRFEALGPRQAWAAVTDPKRFGETGKDGEPLRLVAREGQANKALLKDLSGVYDGLSARVRFEAGGTAHGGLVFHRENYQVYIDSGSGNLMMSEYKTSGNQPRWDVLSEQEVAKKPEYVISVVLGEEGFRVYLDGVEMGRLPARADSLTGVGLQSSHGPATFDEIRIRKKQ